MESMKMETCNMAEHCRERETETERESNDHRLYLADVWDQSAQQPHDPLLEVLLK